MAEDSIKFIRFDFDIRNASDLTPFIFFSEQSIQYYTNQPYSKIDTQDSSHNPKFNEIISDLEQKIFTKKYYGNDNEKIDYYNESVQRHMIFLSQWRNKYSSIENKFNGSYEAVSNSISDIKRLISNFYYILKKNLMEFPISISKFPRYEKPTDNYKSKNEENLKEIIDNISNEEGNKGTLISFEKLIEFYHILVLYTEAYSLTPSFVLYALSVFDVILNSLLSKQKNASKEEKIVKDDLKLFNAFRNLSTKIFNDEEINIKFKYLKLIMLIKLRLYLIIQKMHESLSILLQFIIMEENGQIEFENDDEFSFKKILPNLLPQTKQRSKIITNISMNELFDYFINTKSGEILIITKNGIFNIIKQPSKDTYDQIQIEFTEEEEKVKIKQILEKEDLKFALSDKTLYILCQKDKIIHEISLNKSAKFIKSASIVDIEDYPIISIDVTFHNLRILQRKSYNDNKTTFLYKFIDINSINNNNKYETELNEFIIEDKNKKYKIVNASFSENCLFILYEGSSIEKRTIIENVKFNEKVEKIISPFNLNSPSKVKFDDLFMFVIDQVDDNIISVNQMKLNETRHYISSENKIFLNYPYLHQLSDIVDNCCQFIICKRKMRIMPIEEFLSIKLHKEKLVPTKVDESLVVSPKEMSCVIQSPYSISEQLENIKSLVNELKDENLKCFFVCLFIKLIGINILYSVDSFYTTEDEMNDSQKNKFNNFKSYIFDLFSLISKSFESNKFKEMVRESFIFTFTLGAKFLFISDCYDELHEFMKNLFYLNEKDHEFEKRILVSFSPFISQYPSLLYILDNLIYQELFKFRDCINLQQIFINSMLFIPIEFRFVENVMEPKFFNFIGPYFQSLSSYLHQIITDESFEFEIVEQILSFFFGLSVDNCYYSVLALKCMIEIAPDLYNRIKKMPEVVENDEKLKKINNDIQKQNIRKEIKIYESEHPTKLLKDFKEIITFDDDIHVVLCIIDNRCELGEYGTLEIHSSNAKKCTCQNYTFNNNKSEFIRNNIIEIDGNKIHFSFKSNKKIDENQKKPVWGYKITFIGFSFDNVFYWKPNSHLYFYNHFIYELNKLFNYAFYSTSDIENESEFRVILNEKIIQGIKFEDIDNYESNLNQNKNVKRTLTRGISRGISYDSDNNLIYSDEVKKEFINDLIINSENSMTRGKKFLNFLYSKTEKQNRIRLNESTKSILDIEHYYAACLIKQLGLINLCLSLSNSIAVEKDPQKVEVPNRLLKLWKKVYVLRQNLFFSYQKSKSKQNSTSLKHDFVKFSDEIKRKCKLLLYSDPILKFKTKGSLDDENIESTSKLIFNFITSEMSLSRISELIDARRERLSFTTQSLNLMNSFFDENLLFESSKLILSKDFVYHLQIDKFKGLSSNELDGLNKLFGSCIYKLIKAVYDKKPSFALLCNHNFISSAYCHENNEEKIKCTKLFIEMLENNEKTESFKCEYFNFVLVSALLSCIGTAKDNEITDYVVSLLFNEKIDNQSKQLILTTIPGLIDLNPENEKLYDQSIPFSVLSKNTKNPVIIKSTFYWLSSVYINENNSDFILKVLKGIGRSFTGQSCLFIDDSFQSLSHREVAEGMISFIRLLVNKENDTMMNIINDILMNLINRIKFDSDMNQIDDLYILIGLFESIGQTLSSLVNGRKLIRYDWRVLSSIIFYNETNNILIKREDNVELDSIFSNTVLIDPRKIELNDNEIVNILQFHEMISNSKYFNQQKNYEIDINENEIVENILIVSFYSFLPIIMQNVNNAELLMNEKNLNRSLSLFEFSTKTLPSNENSIIHLSHYLEQQITNSFGKNKTNFVDKNGSFRFIKMNYGEIMNDLIITNNDYNNLFVCSRPFDFECKTYFEIKLKKIGNCNFFIGFVDSIDNDINKAFGFGKCWNSSTFCRRSPYLSNKFDNANDEIMKSDQSFSLKEGDTIGCYYTKEFGYLTLNGELTKYRIFHSSLDSYFPIIYIDHDEMELEIVKNVTIMNEIQEKDENWFNENDVKSADFALDTNKNKYLFKEKKYLIGQQVLLSKTISSEVKSKMEPVDVYSYDSYLYRENYGIIKDIIPIKNNKFVSKIKVESFNNNNLSKEIVNFELDTRFIKGYKTNFYNLIENITNMKFGINGSFGIKSLPLELQKNFDFNKVSSYIKTKTIFDNSKSISIIMTRYLVFILVDYLRFIKSKMIQDEGIESIEMKKILKILSISLPSITSFLPRFKYVIDKKDVNKFTIFKNEDKNIFERFYQIVLPGVNKYFNKSFNLFIQLSENFISPKFYEQLIEYSIENSMNGEIKSLSYLYEKINSDYKIEGFVPFVSKIKLEKTFNDKYLKNNRIIGYIPILCSSIPEGLPSVKCNRRRLRISSDQVSYFNFVYRNKINLKWSYFNLNPNSDIKDYKLKFGLLLLPLSLQEDFVNSSLGFIQILFNIFQGFNNSESYYEKVKNFFSIEFIEKFFLLIEKKKDPLLTPFIQAICVDLISKYGFNDSLFSKNSKSATFVFGNQMNKLVEFNYFPSCLNEFSLLFSIYSTLCKTRTNELLFDKNSEKIFNEYDQINTELFKIEKEDSNSDKNDFIEGEVNDNNNNNYLYYSDDDNDDNKNSRSFYLAYYYSYLLCSDKKFPYPMFLFEYEWMRQTFGGFQKTISKKDIDLFDEKKEFDKDSLIVYKSNVIENNCDLICSSKLNCCNKKNCKNSYKIYIHQLNDDKLVNVVLLDENVNDKVEVSFPLEIIVTHEKDSLEIDMGHFFIVKFEPSEEKRKKCFVENYEQIKKDFEEFNSLSKYDNELFDALNPNYTAKSESNSDSDDDEYSSNEDNNYNDNNNDDDESLRSDAENESNSDGDDDDGSFNNYDEDEEAREEKRERLENAHKLFEIDKIPLSLSVSILQLPQTASDRVVALRYSIIKIYNRLIESLIFSYQIGDDDRIDHHYDDTNFWLSISEEDEDSETSHFMEQIIRPAYSMKTASKFEFIKNILNKGSEEDVSLDLIFNRFEQQKFFNKFNEKNQSSSSITTRPLFVQLMEQVNEESIPLMKVRKSPPFSVSLVGEGAFDAGGPGREIFSSLIIEMMNDRLGIFTYNPNYRHNKMDTNKEDLIPSKYINLNDEMSQILSRRFVFVGALIGCCIVSSIPQNMKLANFIWEFLSRGHLSIESIYEIDLDFKLMIENAESIENKLKEIDMSDDDFNNSFLHDFTIKDSFDNIVELVPSGSKIKVNKQNLHDFIQLAKKKRLHEFDSELEEIREGFEQIMTYRNITSILHPNELRLLACGESSCPIKQMKKLINVNSRYSSENSLSESELVRMFWNVMKKLTPLQRMKFIQYSTGNMGLPAKGLKWPNNMEVQILTMEDKKKGNTMIFAQTCSSEVDIPYFENEEELEKMLEIVLQHYGMITDGDTRLEEVAPELF